MLLSTGYLLNQYNEPVLSQEIDGSQFYAAALAHLSAYWWLRLSVRRFRCLSCGSGKTRVELQERQQCEVNDMVYEAQFTCGRRYMPGTVLRVPASVPPFFHYVMVEWVNFHTGVEWAIHNMPGVGVTHVPLADAIDGKPVTIWWAPQIAEAGELAVSRMQSQLGRRYDLVNGNCEHVVQWAVTGKWKSEQVSNVTGALLIFGALAVAASLSKAA
jgi:hypothetical protein